MSIYALVLGAACQPFEIATFCPYINLGQEKTHWSGGVLEWWCLGVVVFWSDGVLE